jgi:four helix bundle protein
MRKIEVWRKDGDHKKFSRSGCLCLGPRTGQENIRDFQSVAERRKFSLTDQIRRSSQAVNAMIAEAWARRRYPAAFINKIDEALGEAMETQAWLDHAHDCGYLDRNQYRTLDDSWQKVGAMLNRMIQRADDFCRSASQH